MFQKLCLSLFGFAKKLQSDVRGVTALEYAILVVIVIGALVAAGTIFDFKAIFGQAQDVVEGAIPPKGPAADPNNP